MDEEVREMTSNVLLILSVIFFFDGMHGFMNGPIRALGLQKIASYVAISSYWLIGLPAAGIFAFGADLGVSGLQIGAGCAGFT